MFKIVLEPKRLVDLLRKSIISTMLDGSLIRFSESNVLTSSSFGTYGAYATYKPSFFKEYVCDKPTDIRITPMFIKNLEELRINSEEKCLVESDIPNNLLLIIAGGKRWRPNIPNPNTETVGLEDSSMPIVWTEGVGYLPLNLKKQPIHFQAKINVDKIVVPKVEFVSFNIEGTAIKLTWDMDGSAEMNVPLNPTDVSIPHVVVDDAGKKTYKFHTQYLSQIIANLSGEISMTVYERAIFFNMITPDSTVMYFIATA